MKGFSKGLTGIDKTTIYGIKKSLWQNPSIFY
jgi:hypothetical protein